MPPSPRHAVSNSLITWGVATAPLPGERDSGDRYVVAPAEGGVLLAGIDGLGHGGEAAVASQRAAQLLEGSADEGVIALVKRCHKALRATRGVVLTLAKIAAGDDTLTWLGVGNVQGILFRSTDETLPQREQVLLRGGVVGYNLPSLSATVISIARGDLLVIATDGVRPDFAAGVVRDEPPDQLAARLLQEYAQQTDDALVLAARYNGAS